MAKTHMLGLERVPGIEDCIGNFRYLVAAFYRPGHPLRERLGVLGALNKGHFIKGYSDDHWI
jgi:hypothetical protein